MSQLHSEDDIYRHAVPNFDDVHEIARTGRRRPSGLSGRLPHQSAEGRAGFRACRKVWRGSATRPGFSSPFATQLRQCRFRRLRPQQPLRPVPARPSGDASGQNISEHDDRGAQGRHHATTGGAQILWENSFAHPAVLFCAGRDRPSAIAVDTLLWQLGSARSGTSISCTSISIATPMRFARRRCEGPARGSQQAGQRRGRRPSNPRRPARKTSKTCYGNWREAARQRAARRPSSARYPAGAYVPRGQPPCSPACRRRRGRRRRPASFAKDWATHPARCWTANMPGVDLVTLRAQR